MTRYFLKKVTIDGFRGINNEGDPLVLHFKSDAINSIHAPNGVGKSSIFEALHYAIYDTVPRLAALQGGERGDSYIVNKFHSAGQATIALEFSSDDGTANVAVTVLRDAQGNRIVTSPSGLPNPEEFLETLQEDFALLDYSRFVDFIDASALDRGRSFASLVGLNRYSNLRRALQGASDTRNINADLGLSGLKSEIVTDKQAITATEQRLLTAYCEVTGTSTIEIDDIDNFKDQVTKALASVAILKPLLETSSAMEMDFQAAEKVVDKEDGGTQRKRLEELSQTGALLTKAEVAAAEIEDIRQLVALAVERDDAMAKVGASAIHSILKDALEIVTDADWLDEKLCPVCETSLDYPLQDELKAKLELYDEVAKLDAKLNQLIASSIGLRKLGELEEIKALEISQPDRIATSIVSATTRTSVSTSELGRAEKSLLALESKRKEILSIVEADTETLQEKLPPSLVQVTRILSSAKQFCSEVRTYEASLKPMLEKEKKLAKLQRWTEFISKAAETFSNSESKLASDRIQDIQGDCQDLFGKLVRGGPDLKPTLQRASASENVDLTLEDFFGLSGLSARALLSESYRNAVAAAIFLSAAKKHSGVPRFMVLDDVTSSFDAGHQFSLMDALRTQLRNGATPDGLQFIILSHDTSLEKYFDKLNGTSEWHHQKLQGMPPKGRLMVSAQQADRLKAQAEQYLNAGQIDIGEPFVRQYLEYKLGQIISKLEIPVPPDYATRGDRRTLSTFIDAITNGVRLYEAVGNCVLETQQITDLRNHHAPSIMANYVSHYETGVGTPFNAHALLGVVQSIDDLADCFCFVDPNDGRKKYYRKLDRRT